MIGLMLAWLAILVAFVLGAAFNSGAYERGRADGRDEAERRTARTAVAWREKRPRL